MWEEMAPVQGGGTSVSGPQSVQFKRSLLVEISKIKRGLQKGEGPCRGLNEGQSIVFRDPCFPFGGVSESVI